MHIVFDYDNPPGSPIEGRHFVETTDPGIATFLKGLHLATIPIAGTGWDQVTKHPTYPGQTRLQAVLGEIVRLNDTATRTIIGI